SMSAARLSAPAHGQTSLGPSDDDSHLAGLVRPTVLLRPMRAFAGYAHRHPFPTSESAQKCRADARFWTGSIAAARATALPHPRAGASVTQLSTSAAPRRPLHHSGLRPRRWPRSWRSDSMPADVLRRAGLGD